LRQQGEPSKPDLPSRSTPAPSYLNPNPNPLRLPTNPEEVQILGAEPITLQQALELAGRNNRELQQAQFAVERSRAALRAEQAAEYPRLGLGADTTNSGRFILSDEPEQFGQDIDNSSTALSANLNLDYDLYTSGRRSASIRAAREQLRNDLLDFERLTEDTRLNVSTDYYNLQQADENVRIQRASLNNAQASLRDAQALEQAGVGTRFDVLTAQVQVARAQQRLTDALSQQRVSRRQLAARLSLSEQVIITAADPVQISGLWNLSQEQSIVQAFQNRAELEQQLAQRTISQQRRRIALSTLGPQISLAARYNLGDTFGDDGDNNDSTDFNDNYTLRANASLLLFDGGESRARARQEEANIAIAETNFAQTRNQIRLQVEQAYSELQSNFENIQTATVAVEQAREALRLARLRFQAGVGTQTEVIDSEDRLTQAEGERVNAVLSYNRALAQLQRSISSGQQR
jgi:outer membrane protein TolC